MNVKHAFDQNYKHCCHLICVYMCLFLEYTWSFAHCFPRFLVEILLYKKSFIQIQIRLGFKFIKHAREETMTAVLYNLQKSIYP